MDNYELSAISAVQGSDSGPWKMVGIHANHMSLECIATAENSRLLSNLTLYITSGNNTTGKKRKKKK